jgi:serine/threonine protein kinase
MTEDSQVSSPLLAENNTLDIEVLLGQGSTANVYLARRRVGTQEYESRSSHVILKVLTKCGDASEEAKKEARAMSVLQNHPNIVSFHGFSWLENGIDDENIRLPCWAMQLEYCKGGDLHDRVTANRFDENGAWHVMQGIFRGLSHIHMHGYLHRDIKPENILWADGVVKISDFGLCCHTSDEQEMKRRCGSAGYIAPEMILGQAYGPKVDCFSAGTLLYFIVSGKLAFRDSDVNAVLRKTVKRPLDFRKSMRLECLSQSCKQFMTDVTAKDPLHRPTSMDALESEWLSQEVFEALPSSRSDSFAQMGQARREPFSTVTGRRSDDMLACECPNKSSKATFDRLSDASTTYRETDNSKATFSYERQSFASYRETENSKAAHRVERETFSSLKQDEDESMLCEMPFEMTRPPERSVKSKKPFGLSARRYKHEKDDDAEDNMLCVMPFEPTRPEGQPVNSKKPLSLLARRYIKRLPQASLQCQ